ncbi:MAG: hypothetical protein JWO79_3939, partial [Actinomycetia bacterium]|nr:hypothetical protein [Actinomycetes bacterium]
DHDGISDELEASLGTDPNLADTDHDGLDDGRELRFGADPLDPDSDHDGTSDGDEIAAGSDPMSGDGTGEPDWLEQLDRQRNEDELAAADGTAPDEDGDGISDVTEKYFTHTDPDNTDTDTDGATDGDEVRTAHTDPRTLTNN